MGRKRTKRRNTINTGRGRPVTRTGREQISKGDRTLTELNSARALRARRQRPPGFVDYGDGIFK